MKSLQEEKLEWEKEFDKRWPKQAKNLKDLKKKRDLKSFIQEQISLAVQKERERVTSIIQNLNAFVPNTGSDQEQKMRELFKSIINLINPNNL